MKTRIIYLIMSLLSVSVFAQQYGITGIVKDKKTMEGIAFATVSVLRIDSSMVAGGISNETGRFSINNINNGMYILRVSHIGNETFYSPVNVLGQTHLDDILLSENAEMLHEIVVEGKRPFMQQKVDRYIVNISDHLLTAGQNAIDVLRNVPGVLVQNKNVSIMGEGVEILINGHPTHLSGNELSLYLESIQGESIDQVEVMTNASSKFDAEGSRGIINIKTKRNQNLNVMNGSVNTGYELSKKQKGVLGTDLNYQKEKYNIYGSYSLKGGTDEQTIKDISRYDLGPETRTYNRVADCNVYRTISNSYRAGLDLFPNQSNIIGLLFNGFHTNDASDLNNITTITPALVNTALSRMNSVIKNNHSGMMYNANYKHLFDKHGKELNLDVDYARFSNKQNQNQSYLFYAIDNTESESNSSQRSFLPQKTNVWSAKLDYQHPLFEKAFMETGLKLSSTKTDNDICYENLLNGVWTNDNNRSNYFKYKEDISAAYINYAQQLKKWAFQLGLRTEYTHSDGNQVTTSQRNKESYLGFFPSMFIQYAASEKHNFGASYSRRIRRPNYEVLNSFEIRLDNYSYWAGNPYLSPSYNNNIDLKYTYLQKLSATLTWTHNEKMILLEPLENLKDNRYGSVYKNFGSRTAYIFMLNYNDTFLKCWQFNFMGQFAYIQNKANIAVTNFNNNGLSGLSGVAIIFKSAKLSLLKLMYCYYLQ
ncbi:TonB-dependent receptor domain-containing protein [uncultured Bacteroides sp.]|uniref:TonB-dependent receptor domain-containing protein n=1 Tax=uncultured Bacteroides sp. TaxID=162156 RepID=UPI002AABB7AD|nr:TonB-dependent receptor [uncultured Bacteroides sp.]